MAQEPAPAMRWDGYTSTVNRRANGTVPNAQSWTWDNVPVSRDGRFVTITSSATDLVPGDTNNRADVFVRDRMLNTIERVSVSSTGGQGNWDSYYQSISGTGRFVVFMSGSSNLVANDTNGKSDIFIHDRELRTTAIVSLTASGLPSDGSSIRPSVSDDGRFITFESEATNLLDGYTYPGQIYLRDRDTDEDGIFDEPDGTTTFGVSVPQVNPWAVRQCRVPAVSADGRFVTYSSETTNLVPNDTNNDWDVFVWDRQTQQTTRVSVTSTGAQGAPPTMAQYYVARPAITPDGRYVAFHSTASFVPEDTNGVEDVYVHDRETGETSLVSLGPAGQTFTGKSRYPTISDDGRYVLFSGPGELFGGIPSQPSYGLVRDRLLGTTTLGTRASMGEPVFVGVNSAWLSGDATTIVFDTGTMPYPLYQESGNQVYAAVHFAVSMSSAIVRTQGETGTFEVTTTPVTPWTITKDGGGSVPAWMRFTPQSGTGSRTVAYQVYSVPPPPAGSPSPARDGVVAVNHQKISFHQHGYPTILSLGPASGPMTGGTSVTIGGSGFRAPVDVTFGSTPSPSVTIVSETQLRAVAPPSETASYVTVRATVDGITAQGSLSFRYNDATPPVIVATTSGPQNGEWFTGDAQVTWSVTDPHSSIISTSGCGAAVVTQDTPGQSFTCTARSGGGTSAVTVTVKRDATPPTVQVRAPIDLVEPGESVTVDYSCADALSGISACDGPAPSGTSIVLSGNGTPGEQTFRVDAVDVAGLRTEHLAPYMMATGQCIAGETLPLTSWWTADGTELEVVQGTTPETSSPETSSNVSYVAGKVGSAWSFNGSTIVSGTNVPGTVGSGTLAHGTSVAVWIKPAAHESALIFVSRPLGYELAIAADGTLQYRFASDGTWVATPVRVEEGRWTHLAIALATAAASATPEDTTVAIYRNGVLADTQTIAGAPVNGDGPVLIGGLATAGSFVGEIDELQFFGQTLDAAAVRALYLSGASGVCRPAAATLTVAAATAIAQGDVTLRATLASNDIPRADRTLTFSIQGTVVGQAATNDLGVAELTVSLSAGPLGSIVPGEHPEAIAVSYAGGVDAAPAQGAGTLTVVRRTAVLTWQSAGSIGYGTPLGGAHLNATSDLPGTFSYSPAAGTVLPAGTHVLSATFTPADAVNHEGGSTTSAITVTRAPLTVRTDDVAKPFGAPLPAFTVSVAGLVNGETAAVLGGPLTFGTTATLTSAVGTYPVTPGGVSSPNYDITFVPGTLTVAKATTTAILTASAEPSGANEPVTFTARVEIAAPGAGVPSGTVAFYNGSTRLGTVALSATGEARLTTGLAIGTSSLSAQYSGDASFVASTGALSHVVSSSSQSTTTTLTVSPSQASLGQTVTMTATVSRPAGQASGTVRFFDGDTAIGESALVNGVAKLTTNTFASGAHLLSAAYLGMSSAPPSLSKVVALSVGGGTRTPTLALTASPSTGALDAESAFTLKVTGQLFRVPSGQVQFLFDGLPASVAHRVAVQSNTSTSVIATVRLNTLPRGTHRVTAVYLGDGNFRSGAAVLTFVVQ